MDQQRSWIPGKSLGDLPAELVDMIIKLLPMLELAYVSRTCRDLWRLAEPHLYADVNHTFALFRTINNRPELAKHVKAYSYDLAKASKLKAKTLHDKALRRNARMEVNRIFKVPECIQQKCDKEYEICWLLSRFKKLQTVRAGNVGRHIYTPLVLATVGMGWKEFKDVCPNLKNVETILDFFWLRYAEYGYVRLLPRLDSLVIKRDNGPMSCCYWDWLTARQESSLTKLAIEWALVNLQDIRSLVDTSPHLTEFRWYSWVWRLDDQDMSSLKSALQKTKRLARVDIRFQAMGSGVSAESPRQAMDYGFGSFADFSHLEELRIPICALVGWEVPEEVRSDELLPSSLRTLTLTQGLGEVSGYQWTPRPTAALCCSLLSGASKRLPRLQRLAIQRVPRQEWQVWLRPIGQAAAAEGVEWDASRVGTD